MVKNQGGNKSKKGARKHVQSAPSGFTRKAELEGEIYASITNVFGNGRAGVMCLDGIKRLLVIRKKFKGRNKRDNTVTKGTWVLAGRRVWEVRATSDKEVCDLLEVYSQSDIECLKSSVVEDWKVLATDKEKTGESGDLVFEDADTAHYAEILEEMDSEDITSKMDWLDDDVDIDDL